MARTLVLGTRGSKLALWQAHWVQAELARLVPECSITIRTIKTSGDRIQDRPLAQVPGVGFFVKEIEEALRAGEIDLAVHSMKDLPTEQPAGLTIAAMPAREVPYDALVTAGGLALSDLPRGARVGTSSLRRVCQLKHHRPDLVFADVRGNVDTRVRKLLDGAFDALVLAEAGLTRLKPEGIGSFRIPVAVMLPAAGQGALGIEIRSDDTEARDVVTRLEVAATRLAVDAERRVLSGLGGGCSAPIGTLARVDEGQFSVEGAVGDASGKQILRTRKVGPPEQALALASAVAESLFAMGAGELVRRSEKNAS